MGASSAKEASDVIRELLEMLGTAAIPSNTGGLGTGRVYTAELLIAHDFAVELYRNAVTSEAYTSKFADVVMSVNASKTAPR